MKNGVLDLRSWDLSEKGPVELDGMWEFYWDQLLVSKDFTKDFTEDFKQEPLKTGYIKFPCLWNRCTVDGSSFPGKGHATYRLTVLLNKKEDSLALRHHSVSTSLDIWIDGVSVMKQGLVGTSMETSVPGCNPEIANFVPSADKVEILFRISNYYLHDGGPWEYVTLGKPRDILEIRQRGLVFDFFLFGSFVIIGMYHFVLYLLRRNDKAPLYFSMYCLDIALFSIITSESYILELIPSMSWNLFQALMYFTFYVSVPFFAGFVHSLYPREFKKVAVWILMILTGIFTLILIFAQPDFYSWTMRLFQVVTLLMCLYVLIALIVAAYRKRQGALVFLSGFGFLFLMVLNDILYDNDIISTGYLIPFGFFMFIFSQAALLSMRVARALTAEEQLTKKLTGKSVELEELNQTLELKVEDRTAELKSAYEELKTTMEELEASNEHLMELNDVLGNTQRIMDRDMDMAVNVQSNLLPQEAPILDGWEIAFHFKPMSGVSGDFYDFYYDDKKFQGLSLFDVSGHGIASGLITMFSKNVIFRNVTQGRNKPLNEVIHDINVEIIEEIGGVDNYLTGIILQNDGDFLDYVNAGHTRLFMKNGADGSVDIIEEENPDFPGPFLGIPLLMKEGYPLSRFPVKSGDTILAYSDCLLECFNTRGMPYGGKRLIDSFENSSPGLSAREMLDSVLGDFYSFVKKDMLDDDLTVIVLKRV
ncbi:MAG: SpoIIE family protein phosphatase [bacterium]|nr:SpoIIE family protein phosphatase [bacterium]